MNPRDTPGYRLYRALSNLNNIEVEQLEPEDRERIERARAILEDTSPLPRADRTNDIPSASGCGE
jgi:tRNA A37 N6-isopentenylltransferase MiaA